MSDFYSILKGELTTDSLGRGYAAMSDAAAAVDLNTVYRSIQREVIETWEIFEAVVPSEYTALSTAQKSLLGQILAMGTVNVRGANTRAALAGMFGAGTTTRSNLITLQTEAVSRARELGLREIKPGHVEDARRLP